MSAFSKAFDGVSHNSHREADEYGLDEQRVKWAETWLNAWSQRVVIGRRKCSYRPVTGGVVKDSTGSSPVQRIHG